MKLKLVHLPVLLIWAVFVYAGLRGIDFGYHWDEWYHITNVNYDISQPTILVTPYYSYPTMTHALSLASLFPAYVKMLFTTHTPLVIEEPFLSARILLVLVNSLTIFWVYLLALYMGLKPKFALVAAGIVGLSWEFNYHSRFVASDALLAQFTALTLLVSYLAFRRKKFSYLCLSAITVGLTTATKYQGVLLLFLPLGIALFAHKKYRLQYSLAIGILSFLTFSVITPGWIAHFHLFKTHLINAQVAYTVGHRHPTYIVTNALDYLGKSLLYLSSVFSSKVTLISVAIFVLSIFGLNQLVKKKAYFALYVTGLLVFYLLFISVTTKVLIVRNLLLITPWLGILASFGLKTTLQRFGKSFPYIWGTTITALLINAYLMLDSSVNITTALPTKAEIQQNIFAKAKNKTLYISPAAKKYLNEIGVDYSLRLTTIDSANYGVFWLTEISQIPANYPNTFVGWTGGDEINLNYYPTWVGNKRLVLVDLRKV